MVTGGEVMENLRRIRKLRGLKQKELAEIVGVSESSISQYESGKKQPSFEIALKLAEALDCESADLVSSRSFVADVTENKKTATIGDGYSEKHKLINDMFDQCSPDDQDLVIDFLKRLSQNQ